MITIKGLRGDELEWGLRFDRIRVYLDTFAISALAEDRTLPRDRFLAALHRGGSLCFSETSAAELGARQGRGADAVRSFLREVGNCWLPLVMNPFEAIRREEAGLGLRAGVSEDFFIHRFFRQRLVDLSDARLVNLDSELFFDLSEVVRWSQQDRGDFRATIDRFDETLRSEVQRIHATGRSLGRPIFDQRRRATSITGHLTALLAEEAKSQALGRNDAFDFCHAVVGCAYADVLALDKKWKKRVGRLPHADKLPRCFYRNELHDLVDYTESLVARRETTLTNRPAVTAAAVTA